MNNNHKKTHYQLFFSIILCIVTFFIGFTYLTTVSRLKQNLIKSNQNTIIQISQILNNKIKQVQKIIFQVSTSQHINYLLSLDNSENYSTDDIIAIKNATEYFRNIYTNYDQIIDIQIYLKNTDLCCGLSGLQTFNRWNENAFMNEGNQDLINKALENTNEKFILFPEMHYYKNGIPAQVIPIIQKLPTIGKKEFIGAILVFVDKKVLFRDISPSINMCSFSVQDNNNNYLFSWGKYNQYLDNNSSILSYANVENTMKEIEFDNQVLYSTQSKRDNLQFTIFSETLPFLDSISTMRLFFFIMLGLSIIILFITAYKITKNLTSSINKLSLSNNQLNKLLDKQNDEIIAGLLYRVILGNYNLKNQLYETLDFNKVFPTDSKYAILLGKIELSDQNQINNKLQILALIKNNIKEKYTNSNIFIIDTAYDDFTLIIKNFDLKDRYQYIDNLVKKIYQLNKTEFNAETYFSCGRLCNNLFELNASYTEAQFCMQTKDNSKIIYYIDEKIKLPVIYFPLELEQQLMISAKCNDIHSLENIFGKIYTDNFIEHPLNKNGYLLLNSKLKVCLYSLCNDICNKNDYIYQEILKYVTPINQNIDIELDFKKIKEFIIKVANHGNKNKKDNSKHLLECVMKYIDENCYSQQLSLAIVADKYNLSESSLSQQIKELLGIKFQSYVEIKRLDKACELLNMGMKIDSIAKDIGYSNSHSFRRAFKRRFGVNPSNYL